MTKQPETLNEDDLDAVAGGIIILDQDVARGRRSGACGLLPEGDVGIISDSSA